MRRYIKNLRPDLYPTIRDDYYTLNEMAASFFDTNGVCIIEYCCQKLDLTNFDTIVDHIVCKHGTMFIIVFNPDSVQYFKQANSTVKSISQQHSNSVKLKRSLEPIKENINQSSEKQASHQPRLNQQVKSPTNATHPKSSFQNVTNRSKPCSNEFKRSSDEYKRSFDEFRSIFDQSKFSSDRFKLYSDRFKLSSEQFKLNSDRIKLNSDQFKRSSDQFKHSSEQFKRSSEQFKRSSEQFKPSSDHQANSKATYPETKRSKKLIKLPCNVCGETTATALNPLFYCSGNFGHCYVAVHQACNLGVIKMQSSGTWLCDICVFATNQSNQISCELCSNKDGAFKLTETGKFVHTICSLFIPGIRLNYVKRPETVVLSSVPKVHFEKCCYICDHQKSESRAGACIKCHVFECRRYFHVTCGQAKGLLCKASDPITGSIRNLGYCKAHRQQRTPFINFLLPFEPLQTIGFKLVKRFGNFTTNLSATNRQKADERLFNSVVVEPMVTKNHKPTPSSESDDVIILEDDQRCCSKEIEIVELVDKEEHCQVKPDELAKVHTSPYAEQGRSRSTSDPFNLNLNLNYEQEYKDILGESD